MARIRLASACAPVRQIEEHLQPLRNNGVRLPAFDVYYKSDTAGVVFVVRIIKTLFDRQAVV